MRLLKSFNSFLVLLLLIPISLYSQSKDEIIKFLDSKVKIEYENLTSPALSEVFDLELFEIKLTASLDKYEYGGMYFSRYYIKQGNSFKPISSPINIIELPELSKRINSNFKLNTPEDGLILQTALGVIIQEERNEGFFNIGNKWYFIRSEFFGSYFIVETEKDGKIKSIIHTKGIETNIPDDVLYVRDLQTYPDFDIPQISEKDKHILKQNVKETFNYRFEIEDAWSEYFSKISAGKYYEVRFITIEKQGDEQYETSSFVKLIAYNGQFETSNNIWETNLFIESTKPVFQLKTEADAKLFQDFLNEIESKNENVSFEKRDDLWFFYRDKSFGDVVGIIAKTDEKGKIKRLSFSGFEDSDILRFRMKDSDFVVDFGFTLLSPDKATFQFNKDDLDEMIGNYNQHTEIDVKIEFNEVAVNAIGAWVLTLHNGQDVGMYASTNMTSPFSSYIPVSTFPKGTHKVEYLLIQGGDDDSTTIGRVSIDIIID